MEGTGLALKVDETLEPGPDGTGVLGDVTGVQGDGTGVLGEGTGVQGVSITCFYFKI